MLPEADVGRHNPSDISSDIPFRHLPSLFPNSTTSSLPTVKKDDRQAPKRHPKIVPTGATGIAAEAHGVAHNRSKCGADPLKNGRNLSALAPEYLRFGEVAHFRSQRAQGGCTSAHEEKIPLIFRWQGLSQNERNSRVLCHHFGCSLRATFRLRVSGRAEPFPC